MVNRIMEKGLVQVSPWELARLLQEDVKNQIEKSARWDLGKVPDKIQKTKENFSLKEAK